MADQHPYRHNPDESDGDEDPEDQVVFDISEQKNALEFADSQDLYFKSPNLDRNGLCGIYGLKIPALDRFATIGVFRTLLGILCCFQGMFYAFWISIITSIEKQYELSSSQVAFVTSMGEIGRITCLIGLSFFGELAHRPRCIAASAFLVILSYLLLEIPELLAPDSSWNNLMNDEICRPEGNMSNLTQMLSKCTKSDERYSWRLATMSIFTISHFLSGCASTIPIAYGIAVLHDHFAKKDSAMYLGLHFISKVLGPVFGFLLGALSTAMLVNRPGFPVSVERDPRWLNVRAWHVSMGILIISLLNIVVALFMMLFPAEFPADPNTDTKIPFDSKQSKQNVLAVSAYRKTLSSRLMMPFVVVKEDVKKLLPNQFFMTRVFVVVINVFITSGFYVFLPKYLETQFYVQPNAANIATAIAILLPTGCGILAGCFLYRYCNLKPKQSTLINTLTSILFFVGFFILISFRCDTRKMAGSRTADGLVDINAGCNAPCKCDDLIFSPVCDVPLQQNYFSACRAGCEQEPANSSHVSIKNCRCAADSTLTRIHRGFCPISCNKFWPFIFMLFLILFICSVPTVGSVMLIYRTVPADLLQMAHIFMAVCVGILALFPSPMVFGGIMDSSCLLWSTPGCGDKGACLVHDNESLAFQVMGTIGGMKVIAVLIDLYVFWKARKLEFEEIEPAIMWSPDAVRMAFVETVGR